MLKSKYKILAISLLLVIAAGLIMASRPFGNQETNSIEIPTAGQATLWPYQCIDTVKFSRDTARDWQGRQADLENLIGKQMAAVKDLGGNCVSLGTPYDEEFVPFLKLWVKAARQNNLDVWFRGNFSGWEGWFSYPKLTDANQHHKMTSAFIRRHPDLFAGGDIFTPAPEPENGKILENPFASKSARAGFDNFLTDSYANCQRAFKQINKNVNCGYFSVSGNVAKDIFTPELVRRTGSVVVIDHYVDSAGRMVLDIDYLHNVLGAKIALGEFGAPIPDINGTMDENQQAEFIKELLNAFHGRRDIIAAVNYWTLQGGSTALLRDDGSKKPAAKVVQDYFRPAAVQGIVTDTLGRKLAGAEASASGSTPQALTDDKGHFKILIPAAYDSITVNAAGYFGQKIKLTSRQNTEFVYEVRLKPTNPGLGYLAKYWINLILKK